MKEIVKLAIAMILFMGSNILLGSSVASLECNFNKATLMNGIKKALVIVIAFVLFGCTAFIIPDMQLVEVGGESLTVMEAMTLVFTSGAIVYAVKAFKNMFKVLNIDSSANVEDLGSEPQGTEYEDD